MFRIFRKLRQAGPVQVRHEDAAPTPSAPDLRSPYPALLQRWISLASMQQRVIQALTLEISSTSEFVEAEADALSQRFQALAIGAQEQSARVDALTDLAVGVKVGTATISVDDIAALLEQTLGDVVVKILHLSKDSMVMVYALDDLAVNVKRVDKCLAGIDNINRVTNMLALNARIEAERAGTAGATFRVVADEVRSLSKSMQALSITMNEELKAITEAIVVGHETLKKVATVDMSGNILVKERLDSLLPALVSRNIDLRSLVAEAVKGSAVISGDVDGMVTGIQFQDRTKQRLEHVSATLGLLAEATSDILASTASLAPELTATADTEAEWVGKLLERCTMSEVQQRFARVVDGNADLAAMESSDAGSMELF